MQLPISRREAVLKLAVLMGASLVGPRLFALGAARPAEIIIAPPHPPVFTAADYPLLDEIGETIIPATDIPGAKAVGIGAFIAMMVHDCYTPRVQAAVRAGVDQLAANYAKRHRENFVGGRAEHRTAFLNELDAEQRKYTAAHHRPSVPDADLFDKTPVPHYFRVLRELTILGYYSSEIGSTQAVKYLEVPGRYDGDVPYRKGDEYFI
jgi:hypothetical protein